MHLCPGGGDGERTGKMLGLETVHNLTDAVGRLERTLRWLRAMLRDMNRRQTNDESSKLWVQELEDLACDAENLLDEVEYEDLHRKVEGASCSVQPPTENPQVREPLSPPSPHDQFSLGRSILHRIPEIQRRLDDITKTRNDLRLDVRELSEPRGGKRNWPTCSLVTEVFGMEQEKEEMVRFLLAPSSANMGTSASSANAPRAYVSVAAIVGMGGIGKTTLAQSVYNDQRVQRHFDRRMWVWVSDDLCMKKLTKHMLEHFGDNQTNLSIENLNVLQERLRDRLRGKRFLLVLDDVWDEDHDKWSRMHALLVKGGKDSKVIITTRNKRVSTVVRTSKTIKLDGLEFEGCWSVFSSCAFKGVDAGKHLTLEAIGRKIVKKLHGVPLAARTVGGLLYGKLEERHWKEVLESELWKWEQGEGSIFPALRLSYEHLPPHLKQCFAYCSFFPKDCIFSKYDLVKQWIAQGFVHTDGKKRMEDVGSDYFDDLLDRSFFQLVDDKIVMHNLLHQLAQLVSEPNCLHITTRELKKLENDVHHLRHLFVSMTNKKPDLRNMEKLYTCGRLRTIMFYSRNGLRFSIPTDLFVKFTYLRVLVLWDYGLEILPSSIDKLVNLRYLDLSENPIKELPSSLCRMYRLQTLKLIGCNQIFALPTDMSSLINLRHLEAEVGVISRMVGIGSLLRLQKLDVLSISKENGIKVGDLKELNELRGKLCIRNLQRVTSMEEASIAKLKNKLHLKMLELEWGDDGDADRSSNVIEEMVLENLQPPPNLKELTIRCYGGVKCPVWMQYQSISQLQSICLYKCKRWNALPSLGWLPFLRVLNIAHCPHLKELPALPKTLLKLSILDSGLSVLSGLMVLQLQELEISDNFELREVSHLPSTLTELRIKNVPLLESLPGFWECQEVARQDTCSGSPSLSTLKIQSCPRLKSLREGLLQHHLQALRVLSIIDCPELVHWPEGEGFRATLLSLEDELYMENCPKLSFLPEGCILSVSLKTLTIKGCSHVANRSLFIQLHNLTSKGVYVANKYQNFSSFCDGALQHMRELDVFKITYVQHYDSDDDSLSRQQDPPDFLMKVSNELLSDDQSLTKQQGLFDDSPKMLNELVFEIDVNGDNPLNLCPPFPTREEEFPVTVSLIYDRVGLSCIGLDDAVLTREIKIEIGYNTRNQKSTEGSLFWCLHSCHESASSLRWLVIAGFPYEEYLAHVPGGMENSFLPHLPSLLSLMFQNCGRIMRLPMETLLCHLSSLRELSIMNCPEMRLSSVDEAIHSLPSIKKLAILDCPNLLDVKGCDLLSTAGSLSSCASSSSMPPPVLLQSLTVDEFKLFYDQYFVCSHLTSLHELRLWGFGLSSFTAMDDVLEMLRCVARPVEILEFLKCSSLPLEMGSLFPSLKRLQIENCPEIRCMTDKDLPHSLERLEIIDCPTLAKRCRPPREEDEDSSEGEDATRSPDMSSDWQLVARIPNIEIDGRIIQGYQSKT